MPVTVRYENDTAALFASEADALAQAAHDLSYPGHASPVGIWDGDHSAMVVEKDENDYPISYPAHVKLTEKQPELLHGKKAVLKLRCSCDVCEYQRTGGFPNGRPE